MKPIVYRDHLILPADPRLSTLVPHAKEFEHNGERLVLVPHRVDEAQILRNFGYDIRPPILDSYKWPGPTPFDAQRLTAALITMHKRSFVLNGLGTGKTRSTLYAFDYLKQTGQLAGRGMLVVAPLSTLRQTWEREIATVFPHLSVSVLHNTNRKKRLAALDRDADVYVINHDGVETILAELMEAHTTRNLFGMCALDELTVYKNANTEIFKQTYSLVRKLDRVTGLTGTPVPTAATDAYGQIKMLRPDAIGMPYGRFRELVQKKVTKFKWVNKPDALDRVFKLMQPAVRFTRDECYDMPPVQYVPYMTQLSDFAAAAFRAIQTQGAVKELNVRTVTAADIGNKMLQIALGAVYDEHRNVHRFDVTQRLDLLRMAIEQSASKVIVFSPYKHTLQIIREFCEQRWQTAVVSGDVSASERERIYSAFQLTDSPQVLVAHPECMSHGLTLTEASTIVWWGPPASLETYEQANGRITRAGQRHSQLIIQLMATKLEERVFRLLETRANVQQALLEMFESQNLEDLL